MSKHGKTTATKRVTAIITPPTIISLKKVCIVHHVAYCLPLIGSNCIKRKRRGQLFPLIPHSGSGKPCLRISNQLAHVLEIIRKTLHTIIYTHTYACTNNVSDLDINHPRGRLVALSSGYLNKFTRFDSRRSTLENVLLSLPFCCAYTGHVERQMIPSMSCDFSHSRRHEVCYNPANPWWTNWI